MIAYAGIGSTDTPKSIQKQMTGIATQLSEEGWTLRSGGAPGADQAFEKGAGDNKQIFLPWRLFNQSDSPYFEPPQQAYDIAAYYHPTWHKLMYKIKRMMARNVQQVFGLELDQPCEVVLCWTPDGAETRTTRETGGTGQAIRIAIDWDIPIINFLDPLAELRLESFLELYE